MPTAVFFRATYYSADYSYEKAVCRRSVCLSNAWNCDKTEERSVQIFISYERSFSL